MTDWRPNVVEVFEYYNARVVSSSGQWQKAQCPLLEHEDQDPSASVNEEAGKWRCWVCDKAGDGLDIVKENEGLAGFVDCLRFAETHFGGSDRKGGSEPLRRGGLSVRSGNHRGDGTWVPPWSSI